MPPLRSSTRIGWTAAAILAWLLVVYILPPSPPVIPGLDFSWQAVLTEQFLHSWQAGKDILFTYGPWGFLYDARGDPSIYSWKVLGRSVIALGWSAGIAWLAWAYFADKLLLRWVWLILIVWLAQPYIVLPFALLAVLFESTAEKRPPALVVAPVLVACALAAQAKFSAAPLACGVVLLSLFDDTALRKRFPVTAAVFAGSYLGFALLAGQRIASLGPYFSGALSLSSAYNSGMYLFGPRMELAAGVLLCAGMPACYLAAVWSGREWSALPRALWVAAYFLLALKEGYVRQDSGHIWDGIVGMAIPGSLMLVPVLSRYPLFAQSVHLSIGAGPPRSLPLTGVVALFLTANCILFTILGLFWGIVPERVGQTMRTLRYPWSSSANRLEIHRLTRADYRTRFPLGALEGSVDVFPWDAGIVLANSLDYRPRPVFQSYAVLNGRLARLNADYFAGDKAPDFVLMDPQGIDNRYPSTMDNLAWRELLARYEPGGFSGSFVLLARSRHPAELQMAPLLARTLHWNESMEVPPAPGAAIWAEVDVVAQPWGDLAALLLRPAPVVFYLTAGNSTTQYRHLPAIGHSGFLLSPVVDNPLAFAALYMGKDTPPSLAPPVSRVSFETGMNHFFYQRDIAVRLYTLTIPTRTPPLLSREFIQLGETVRTLSAVDRSAPPPSWAVSRDHPRIEVSDASRGYLEVSRSTHAIAVGFGLGKCPATVEFRVSLGGRILMRKAISTRGSEEALGEEIIDLPKSAAGQLLFETSRVAGDCSARVFWLDLKPR